MQGLADMTLSYTKRGSHDGSLSLGVHGFAMARTYTLPNSTASVALPTRPIERRPATLSGSRLDGLALSLVFTVTSPSRTMTWLRTQSPGRTISGTRKPPPSAGSSRAAAELGLLTFRGGRTSTISSKSDHWSFVRNVPAAGADRSRQSFGCHLVFNVSSTCQPRKSTPL